MKKIAEKILFIVFMSKVIDSFPYAVALAKSVSHVTYGSMSHDMETPFKFLCQEPHCGKLTEPRHMENC